MKKQNDLFSELIVGVFMVVVVALLGYFTIVISGADLLSGKARVRVRVEFSDVAGLKERDNVIYRGMKVGTVEKIQLGADKTMVCLSVDRDVILRQGYMITVKPLSLLGGNCLLMEEGVGDAYPLTTTLFQGTPPTDWMRDLGEIARRLNKVTGRGGLETIVSNFEAMSFQLRDLTARVAQGEGTLGRLLATNDTIYVDISETVSSAKTLAGRLTRGEGTLGRLLSTNDQIYVDIADTVSSAKKVAGRLEQGEGTLGKLLSKEETVYRDLKHTLARAAEISDRLTQGEGTLGRLLAKDDALYNDLRAAIADIRQITGRVAKGEGVLGRATQDSQMADDASRLLANLKNVSDHLAQGKGTLGRLTTDAELYNEVNALIKDVRQVVDNYRDTTPISSFAGLAGGAL